MAQNVFGYNKEKKSPFIGLDVGYSCQQALVSNIYFMRLVNVTCLIVLVCVFGVVTRFCRCPDVVAVLCRVFGFCKKSM